MDSKEPNEIPDFVISLYLGDLDNKIDAILCKYIKGREMEYFRMLATRAYMVAFHPELDVEDDVDKYLSLIDNSIAYFEVSHWGYTRLLGYYYRLMNNYLNLGLTKKDFYKLALVLKVSQKNLYNWAVLESEDEMDPTTKERASNLFYDFSDDENKNCSISSSKSDFYEGLFL